MEKLKTFRISAKNLFLTYKEPNKECELFTRESILAELSKKHSLKIENYLVAKETCKNDEFHYHVILRLLKKCDIKNCNALDILGIHGSYEPVRNLEYSIYYVLKEDKNYLSNFDLLDGKFYEDPEEFVLKLSETRDINELILDYSKKYPKRALKHLVKLKKTLETVKEVRENVGYQDIIKSFPYTLENVDWSHLDQAKELDEWFNKPDGEKETLILIGPANSGKTFLILAYCKTKEIPTLYTTDFEGFKHLKQEHKIWILDDCNLAKQSKINGSALTQFLDNSTPTDLRLLGKSSRRPHGMTGIIMSNDIKEIIPQDEKRILKRSRIIHIEKPINYINVNIQNNFFVGDDVIQKNKEIWNLLVKKTKEELLGLTPNDSSPTASPKKE